MRDLLYTNLINYSVALQFLFSESSLTRTDKSFEYLMSPSLPVYFASLNNIHAFSIVELTEKCIDEATQLIEALATSTSLELGSEAGGVVVHRRTPMSSTCSTTTTTTSTISSMT